MVAQGRGGAIVNVSSKAGMTGLAGNPGAEAAKANPSDEPNLGRAKTFSLLAYADPQHRPATVSVQVSMMLFLLSGEASNFTDGVFPTDGDWTSY